jgi:hypothetical protein
MLSYANFIMDAWLYLSSVFVGKKLHRICKKSLNYYYISKIVLSFLKYLLFFRTSIIKNGLLR